MSTSFLEISLYAILKTSILLGLIYLAIQVLSFLLLGISLPSKQKTRIENILRASKNSFFPFSLFVLLVLFCIWKPVFIGVPAFLGLLFFFNPLRNFLLGFLVRGKNNINIGTDIKVDEVMGRIEEWNYSDIKLATKDGILSMPYGKLVENPYVILSQGDRSNNIQLDLVKSNDTQVDIIDRLSSSPFLKLNTRITVLQREDDEKLSLSLIPKSEVYKDDIFSIIKDAGYNIQ